MGSQRGGGGLSENQSKAAREAYYRPRDAGPRTPAVSPSSLIKRRVKLGEVKQGDQQGNNQSNTNT